LPDWHKRDGRAFGSAWLEAGRSALLIVPSRVAREERNILINPRHPDAKASRTAWRRRSGGTSGCLRRLS